MSRNNEDGGSNSGPLPARAAHQPFATGSHAPPPIKPSPPDEEPALIGEPLERPPFLARLATLIVIVVPQMALAAAIWMIWDTPSLWLTVGMLLGGYVLTVLGVTIGYHRLFTHKSFKASPILTLVLGILGSMAVEGPILEWVATHRRHHQHTDRPDDPHSPHVHGTTFLSLMRGMAHAHVGWFFSKAPTPEFMQRYVPDLQADRLVSIISRLFPLWVALGLLIPFGIAFIVTGTWVGAFMGLVWGGLLRVLLVHHVTWSVNSVCHLWGQRPFNTHDESRNNPIFGVLALGEGWHNNHHAFPTSAKQGLEWWQIDVSYLIIRLLWAIGLVRDIRVPPPERIAAKRRAA